MMIFIASDHGGFAAKQKLVRWLIGRGWPVTDLGPRRRRLTDDYPVWASRLARAVQDHPGSRGILLCRSGVGMAIVANRFSAIRAAQAFSPAVARQSRRDEDTNVLSLAADYQSPRQLQAIATAWLRTRYRPIRRFQRRLTQIARLDHGR